MISLASLALCASMGMAQTGIRDKHDGDGNSIHARYGGSIYNGAPTLDVTWAMVDAGGGAGNFSIERALRKAAGEDWVTTELSTLTEHYGRKKMRVWAETFEFAVTTSIAKNEEAGMMMPKSPMQARRLAMAMVNAGVDEAHTFTTDLWMDRTESHTTHMKVMDAMDKQYGSDADADCHQISNQLFFDLARHLNMTQVNLAGFH